MAGAAGCGGSAPTPPRHKEASWVARSASRIPAPGAAMATLARVNWTRDGEASGARLRTGGVDAWSRGGRKGVECLSINLHGLGVRLSINPARGRGGVKT